MRELGWMWYMLVKFYSSEQEYEFEFAYLFFLFGTGICVCPFQSGLFNLVENKLFIMLGSVCWAGVVENSGTAFQTPAHNVLWVLAFCPNILIKEDVEPLWASTPPPCQFFNKFWSVIFVCLYWPDCQAKTNLCEQFWLISVVVLNQ